MHLKSPELSQCEDIHFQTQVSTSQFYITILCWVFTFFLMLNEMDDELGLQLMIISIID